MGQTLSGHDGPQTRTREELRRDLANKLAQKCFTSIELYSLKQNFETLADVQQGVHYWKEDTFVRFLELPDALQVSPVLFHMVSFLGAFPFLSDAPMVLGLEEMVTVVALLTDRYRRVLSKGATDRKRLLFKSLAVYDRQVSEKSTDERGQERVGASETTKSSRPAQKSEGVNSHAPGFAVDQAGVDEPEDGSDEDGSDEDEDDGLVLSAFELFDCAEAYKVGGHETTHGAMIPADNLRRLITLLLLIAPLGAQERLSQYPLDPESLHVAADNILAAFLNVEKSPGVKFRAFSRVLDTLPFMFEGFNALFEHLLFSRTLDLSAKINPQDAQPSSPAPIIPIMPALQQSGSILTATLMSQLSFFIPGSTLFRRLHPLYSGDRDGFSMGSFETSVFNWRAPSLLLVRGSRYSPDDGTNTASEDRFAASLPPKRFPDGADGTRLTFGLYVAQPWRHSHKECFGDADSLLFQLEPVQDVFPASTLNRDYVSFIKPGSAGMAGIAIGNPPPRPSASSYGRRQSIAHLGPVSLLLDGGFEFGVFTHDFDSKGGAFRNSEVRRSNFQDRFEVESLEVWGLGGGEEAKAQAERWAWEAKEAEARRRINLGTGDVEADRQLLEMAGLVGGGNRSGGSMG
ncbi:unnamed protein product [Discula destructiva]